MRRYFYIGFSIILLSLLATVVSFYNFLKSPINIEAPILIEIPYGATISSLDRKFFENDYFSNKYVFTLYAMLSGNTSNMQVGEYELAPGITPIELLTKITSGAVKQYQFTIKSGDKLADIVSALHSSSFITKTFALSDLEQVSKELTANKYSSLEGLLLPETYNFVKGDRDLDLISRSYKAMQSFIQKSFANDGNTYVNLDDYEKLILASIVEKESGLAAEYGLIAGVYSRRLAKDMKLQADPTVAYGLGINSSDITKKDLRTKGAYNSYINKGLPPTPICMPSKDSIIAVLSPVAGNALYFVAKTRDPEKGHVFSDTYDQHKVAVRNYLKELRNE